ncbi:hypothetical protein EV121DRAFT_205596 [Schizophyllum commune]
MPKYSSSKSAPSTKYVVQLALPLYVLITRPQRHPYRIISMPGTSTVPAPLPSPRPPAQSAGPSKKTPRSRKGQPRILKAAPPPPPGEHSVYRTEAQRFDYLSTHPWVAAFSVVGARCAACRRRILADIRTKGKYVVPNFTRHIDEKCRARKAIEEGRKAFPEEKLGEKPLETDHRKGRRGFRFEVFAGGAPMPGTILEKKEKAKCIKATKKMDVDDVDLCHAATQSISHEWKRISISAASAARTPSPEPPAIPMVVIDSPEPTPQYSQPMSQYTQSAQQHSQTMPHYSQTAPQYSQSMPHYSAVPTVDLLPPRFRMSAAFASTDLPPPSMSQADWDMESEDESDDEDAYSAPVDVLYRVSEEHARFREYKRETPGHWRASARGTNVLTTRAQNDRPTKAERACSPAVKHEGSRLQAKRSSANYRDGTPLPRPNTAAMGFELYDRLNRCPVDWNGYGTPLVYRAHVYKRGSYVLRHQGRDVWEYSTDDWAAYWKEQEIPYDYKKWDEIMKHIEYGFRNPIQAEVNVLVHAGPNLIGVEPLPYGPDPSAYLPEHLFPRCDLESTHQLREYKRRTGKVYRA